MSGTLVIIFNIPAKFGASDLRNFFTTYVEAEKIACFHFKRRPESKLQTFSRKSFLPAHSDDASEYNTNVALVEMSDKSLVDEFCSFYHHKYWTDGEGVDLDTRCFAFPCSDKLKIDVKRLPEFRPPSVAPRGNVGTTTKFFLSAINQCRLSPKVIAKLGLDFKSRRKRAFCAVPPPASVTDGSTEGKKSRRLDLNLPESSSKRSDEKDDDGYEEEEWDRHRALHDDVSARRVVKDLDDLDDQPGTKDRLFEEKMEVTWDKGSSGLVFYTDAQFWREHENHEEAEDADDWDVDTSEYEVPGSGDKDARDAASMRESDGLRGSAMQQSAFRRLKVGSFESHTRGIGRRLLEHSGWKDGDGLGSSRQGRPEAVDGSGQQGRSGLGYKRARDERKLEKAPGRTRMEKDSERIVRISTIFDDK